MSESRARLLYFQICEQYFPKFASQFEHRGEEWAEKAQVAYVGVIPVPPPEQNLLGQPLPRCMSGIRWNAEVLKHIEDQPDCPLWRKLCAICDEWLEEKRDSF